MAFLRVIIQPSEFTCNTLAVELSSELAILKVYWFAEPASLLPDAVLAVQAPPKEVN